MTLQFDQAGSIPEETPRSDRERLEAALPDLATALAGAGVTPGTSLRIERQFAAGQSNPTYLLGAGSRLMVLRKQPYGSLMPRAHDVAREHDIIKALHGAGFPVPAPIHVDRGREVIGTSFFLMSYVPGAVHSDAYLPDSSPTMRAETYGSLATSLADLHGLPPSALETAGIKPRGDFVGRQIGVWRAAYKASETEPDPRVDTVAEWLLANKPATEELGVTHGDYRIENVIFQDAATAAVLDWELCTIGDTRSDLAYCCLWYHMPGDLLGGLAGCDLGELGIPDEARFLDLYEVRRGVGVRGTHRYFLIFAFYRLAAILQGVFRRALNGNASSPQALTRGSFATRLLGKATELAEL